MLELSECVPLPDDRLDDLPALLDCFLSTLRDDERRLFVGRYWHGYTAESLAEAFGITPNAAVLRLRRTREKLRAYLTERGYRI
jgi:RNA polymerase sigma-70 factor (ECF subfamily)